MTKKLEDDELLTRENWKAAVVQAIEELPTDIQQSIGYAFDSAEVVNISIAGTPFDVRQGETCLSDVEVRWWESRRFQLETTINEQPDIGFEGFLEDESRCSPVIDKPTISIFPGDSTGVTTGVPVWERGRVGMLMGLVQQAVLDQMFVDGLLTKDKKGRFIRFDLSRIWPPQ